MHLLHEGEIEGVFPLLPNRVPRTFRKHTRKRTHPWDMITRRNMHLQHEEAPEGKHEHEQNPRFLHFARQN